MDLLLNSSSDFELDKRKWRAIYWHRSSNQRERRCYPIIQGAHMPSPYEFKSEAELIEELQSTETIAKAKMFFSERCHNFEEVVETGISGNTFRAFRNLPVRPSQTFRDWAKEYLSQTSHLLKSISSSDQYTGYVREATNDLCSQWKSTTSSEMGFGRGAKLLNLVLKRYACLEELSGDQRNTLISLQHVPLDSYTIIGLRTVADELAIPRNATMKFVTSQDQYLEFQNKISIITKKAGVPAIYYDILAWNRKH
jgi:hypothetical protein